MTWAVCAIAGLYLAAVALNIDRPADRAIVAAGAVALVVAAILTA